MWGSASGIILEIAPENIYASYHGDMDYVQRLMEGRTGLLSYFKDYGLVSPEELLSQTPRSCYNEVVVGFGGDYGPPIRLLGFFNRPSVRNFPDYVFHMENYATELGIPVLFDESTP